MPTTDTIYLTREGIDGLKEELDYLRITRRREVADLLRDSRDGNWASETDAPYDPARDEQAFVEGRIAEIEAMLGHARILDSDQGRRTGRVALGATVVVDDARGRSRRYQIVSSAETDPAEGKVSDASPVGRALMGAAAGDVVTVQAPAGAQQLTVREIQ